MMFINLPAKTLLKMYPEMHITKGQKLCRYPAVNLLKSGISIRKRALLIYASARLSYLASSTTRYGVVNSLPTVRIKMRKIRRRINPATVMAKIGS